MVVTNDEVHAFRARIGDLFDGLDATIQSDNQCKSIRSSVIYALCGNPIPFAVAIRYVKLNTRMKGSEKAINDGHGGGAVHIIIAVDQDFFVIANSFFDTKDGLFHILHQKRIVKVIQTWSEEDLGLCVIFDVSIDQ